MQKFKFLEIINTVKEKWEPEDIAFINDTALRVAKVEGAYHWHIHPNEDEFFFVLSGRVIVDTESDDGSVELNPMEGYLVKRGIRHRSRTEEPAWILFVEPTRTRTKGIK